LSTNFFQISISDDVGLEYSPNQENILSSFSDIDYKIFSFRTIVKELKINGDSEILEAFNKLRPYAFKADLARYYLLNKYGGWYSDVNNYFSNAAKDAQFEDFYAFHDIPKKANNKKAFQNSIIYSKPENPILKGCIDQIILNAKSRFYGVSALSVSGPILFGEKVYEHVKNPKKLGTFSEKDDGRLEFIYKGNTFATYKPIGNMAGDSGIPMGNDYVSMWEQKDVYAK
jgi:hypothetical protein